MKPPVPGDMVLYRYAEGDWSKALFIQHVDYPDQVWLDRQHGTGWDHLLQHYQGPPRGWWYVMEDGQPTYWMPPEEVYVYDGSRWRKQQWKDGIEESYDVGLDDLSIRSYDDNHGASCFHLVSEEYLPEGENPPTT